MTRKPQVKQLGQNVALPRDPDEAELERVAAIDLITDDLRNLALKVSANRRA